MAEVDLGPDELDRLEDALEGLELDGALERWSEDELGPQVYARLVDYRAVLAATREAMPLEDVRAGVLDGVLAQAEQAAAMPAVAAGGAQEPWWSRLRRSFMVPALALAGTAALVLWVLDPKDQVAVIDSPAPPAAPAADEARARTEAEPQSTPSATPAMPVEAAARLEEAEPSVAPSDDAEGALVTGEAGGAKDSDKAAPAKLTEGDTRTDRATDALGSVSGGAVGRAGAVPGAAQSQTKATSGGSSTAGRWDIVARGDRARQAGNCIAARDEYALALEDDEPQVRARAFAGLGLCDAAVGDEASADANYERARSLDDGIAGFIASQSERSRTEKKSPKPARKSKLAPDNAFDPYD
jgi:hypothetical protein